MASRYYSEYRERKISHPGHIPRESAGPKSSPTVRDAPVNWPKPSPTWGNGFNRATKHPVIKTSVVKHGGPY